MYLYANGRRSELYVDVNVDVLNNTLLLRNTLLTSHPQAPPLLFMCVPAVSRRLPSSAPPLIGKVGFSGFGLNRNKHDRDGVWHRLLFLA